MQSTFQPALENAIVLDDLATLKEHITISDLYKIINDTACTGTPIFFAACYDSVEILKFLVLELIAKEKPKNLIDQLQLGKTILKLLNNPIDFGDALYPLITSMVDARADLTITDEQGNSILHVLISQLSCCNDEQQIMQLGRTLHFFLEGSNGLMLNQKNKNGELPLHIICEFIENPKILAVLKQVLKYTTLDQLDAQHSTWPQQTAMDVAFKKNNRKILKLLVECAQQLKKQNNQLVCKQDAIQLTYLREAIASRRDLQLVQILATPENQSGGNHKETVIEYAALYGNKEIVEFLLYTIFPKISQRDAKLNTSLNNVVYRIVTRPDLYADPQSCYKLLTTLFDNYGAACAPVTCYIDGNILHTVCLLGFNNGVYLDIFKLLLKNMEVATLAGEMNALGRLPLHMLGLSQTASNIPMLKELLPFTDQSHLKAKDKFGHLPEHSLLNNSYSPQYSEIKGLLQHRQTYLKQLNSEEAKPKVLALMRWLFYVSPLKILPFDVIEIIFDYCAHLIVNGHKGDARFNLCKSEYSGKYNNTVKLGFYSRENVKELVESPLSRFIYSAFYAVQEYKNQNGKLQKLPSTISSVFSSKKTIDIAKHMFDSISLILKNDKTTHEEKGNRIEYIILNYLAQADSPDNVVTTMLLEKYALIIPIQQNSSHAVVSLTMTNTSSLATHSMFIPPVPTADALLSPDNNVEKDFFHVGAVKTVEPVKTKKVLLSDLFQVNRFDHAVKGRSTLFNSAKSTLTSTTSTKKN